MAVTRNLSEALLSAIPDALKIPLFVVGEYGAIFYANAATTGLMLHSGSLEIADATLSAKHPSDNKHLRRAIANASINGKREIFAISDYRSHKPQFICVAPLQEGAGRAMEVLVMVPTSFTADMQFGHILHDIFGLSPSECSIAEALVDCVDAGHIAELRGVKINTVRAQIATIMLKTGTHKQGELVALLSRVANLP